MNPNASDTWRRTVAGIESHMTGKTDWVLVKPYYDASIAYTGQTGGASTDSVIISDYSQSGSLAFGDSSEWYNYAVSIVARNITSTAYTNRTVKVFLSNRPFSFVGSDRQSEAQAQASVVLEAKVTLDGNRDTTININSGHIATNLCRESATVYYYVYGLGVDQFNSITIQSHTLTATTAATSRKVPCTVYYYH